MQHCSVSVNIPNSFFLLQTQTPSFPLCSHIQLHISDSVQMEGGNTSCMTQWQRTHFPKPDLSKRLLNKYHPLCHTAKQRQGQPEGPDQDVNAAQQMTPSATYIDEK